VGDNHASEWFWVVQPTYKQAQNKTNSRIVAKKCAK